MAIIQFENGTKVNFEGNPTPDDIEEVAQGMNQPAPQNKVQDFIGNTLLKAPVTMAARIGQLGGVGIAGAASKLTGNPQYYENAKEQLNQPMRVPAFGTDIKPVNQETPESIAGEGLGTVALGASNPALAGGLIGGSSALQENGSVGDVAMRTGVGSALGYAGGKLAGAITNKLMPTHFEDTLIKSGSVLPEGAGQVADVLRNIGVKDISSPQGLAYAQNLVGNMSSGVYKASAQRALAGVSRWLGTEAPQGLLSKLAGSLKAPALIGGGYLLNKYGGGIQNATERALTGGGL